MPTVATATSTALQELSAFASHNTFTVKSALKRLSISIHRPRVRRSSTTSSHMADEVDDDDYIHFTRISPPAKRAPHANHVFSKTPADLQLEIIDLVCNELEMKMSQYEVIDDVKYLCFQGPNQPAISVRDYICRLVKYANHFCEDAARRDSSGVRTLLLAMEFLKRSKAVLNSRTVHRYLMISMLIALKTMEDCAIETEYWSTVGGCTSAELNYYEVQFLNQLQFRCHVTNAQFNEINACFGYPFDYVEP